MSDLKMGDGLLLRAFKDHPSDTVQLSYTAPKGKHHYHLAVWLGIWTEGEQGVDERLNRLGWVFDPQRARELCSAAASVAGTGTAETAPQAQGRSLARTASEAGDAQQDQSHV